MSLSLAVARRALLLALVALLVAVVALVAAFVADSGSDDAADVVDRADLAEARAAAAAAQASAEDAAIMSAASAAKADEAAVVAQEAVVMAQQAAAAAEAAAAQAALALEALAAAGAEGDAQPAETSDAATEAETPAVEADTAGATEEAEETAEPADSETDVGDTGAATDTGDGDASGTGEDEPGDESGEASTDEAGGAPDDAPEPAVSLPGEPYEYGPAAGAALAVVGVSHDSVLNVRDVPAGKIVARLDNVMNVGSEPVVYVREADSDELIATLDLNRGVIATGKARELPTTIWYEIRMADAVGWASGWYLSPLGATSDATARIVANLGETPAAPTLAELARVVAEAVASDEDPTSHIVVSGAPVIGDLAEITVDVLGLPDDAVRGFRLQVFAEKDSESDLFTLRAVESTTICVSHRGVSEEGLCH